jgi:uncharacterized protein
MTPQEQDLLTTLLGRLKNAAGQPKDPDADALIRQTVAEQPDSPYFLAQTVLIQDLSLHNAQNQIAALQQQLSEAQQQAARPATPSFLGSLFGSRPPQPAAPPAGAGSVPATGPWTRAPQVAAAPPAQPYGQPYQQGGYSQPMGGQPMGGGGFMGGGAGGGGFLRSAATTAAGIAGGALLFQGIESLFGQHASAGILGGQAMTPGLGESVVNNYYGTDAGAGQGGTDQDFSGGSFDPSGGGQDQDFSGGSFDPSGGGQDYSSDQDFSGGQDQDFSGGDFGGGDSNQC